MATWDLEGDYRVLRLSEYETIELPLAEVLTEVGEARLYPEVTKQQFASVGFRGGRIVLQAGCLVGQMRVSDSLVLVVEPRVPVRNLNHLLEVTTCSPVRVLEQLRAYDAEPRAFKSFVDIICEQFLVSVQPLFAMGLHQSEVWANFESSFPAGRIDFAKSAARFFATNRPHRVVHGRFVPAIDTAPNRAVKYAAQYLGWHYQTIQALSHARRFLRGLDKLWGVLEGIEFDASREFLRDSDVLEPVRLGRRYSYYMPVLSLARLVAQLNGIEVRSSGGSVELAALLVKMEDVFEEYVRQILRVRINSATVLDGNKSPPSGAQKPLFDEGGSPAASPDVVIVSSAGVVLAVLDVKYKPYLRGPERADINQLVTYATAFRAPFAILVTPGFAPNVAGRPLGRIGESKYLWQCLHLLGDSEVEEARFCESIRRFMGIV